MATPSNPPCVKHYQPRGEYRFRLCGKRGKIQHEERWYCGRHDPAQQLARDEARRRLWRLQDADRAKAEQRQRDMEAVLRWVGTTDRRLCAYCLNEYVGTIPHPPLLSAGQHLKPECPVALAERIVAELDAEREVAGNGKSS